MNSQEYYNHNQPMDKIKIIDYLLQGFGYLSLEDFQSTVFRLFYLHHTKLLILVSFSLGVVREVVESTIGLDIAVLGAFVFLIIAEWQTGLKVALSKENGKFRSRKFGRMILKIGIYINILFVLFIFSSKTKVVEFVGFEVNPMSWLYHTVFAAITIQLLISYLENLGNLGYKEARGIVGIILRKANKWFEFDGTKDGDNFNKQ